MFDMQKTIKQMQKKLEDAQQELEASEIEGSSGGGAVVITCNGKNVFQSVKIKPEAAGDAGMLEDLVLAALQDVNAKIDKLTQEKMHSVTGGVKIPGLPF